MPEQCLSPQSPAPAQETPAALAKVGVPQQTSLIIVNYLSGQYQAKETNRAHTYTY